MLEYQRKKVLGEGIIRPTKDRIHLENILNFSSNKNVYIYPLENCHIYLVEKINQEQVRIISEDKKYYMENMGNPRYR